MDQWKTDRLLDRARKVKRVRFSVPGVPMGKGRPRFARIGKGVRTYSDAPTMVYENLVRTCLVTQSSWDGEPLTGPVALRVVAHFPIPKSWSKAKQAGARHHTSKPDLDNVTKAVLDALNGVAWADDSAVANIEAFKVYTNGMPSLEVTVEELLGVPYGG